MRSSMASHFYSYFFLTGGTYRICTSDVNVANRGVYYTCVKYVLYLKLFVAVEGAGSSLVASLAPASALCL